MEEGQEHSSAFTICTQRLFNRSSMESHFRRHLRENSVKNLQNGIGREITETGSENGDATRLGFAENPKKVSRVSDSTHTLENSKISDLELEDCWDASHGLRENPKRSWRASDGKESVERKDNCCKECGKEFLSLRDLTEHLRSHLPAKSEIICRECGKRFGSVRALCGHMRHHPKKSRICNESVTDSQSVHGTIQCPVRKKRSKMSYISCSTMSSSSNVSEVDEEEEAAMCLLMLSTGWVSSENEELGVSSGGRLLFDACKSWKVKKMRQKSDYQVSCSGYSLSESEFDELGCGLISKNTKEAEVGVLDDGFREVEEFKKPELVAESMEVISYLETENVSKVAEKELGNVSMTTDKFEHVDEADIENGFNGIEYTGEGLKSSSSMEARSNVHGPEMGVIFSDGADPAACRSQIVEDCEKKGEYKCRTCHEVFYSHGALVAHRSIHKTTVVLVDNIKSHECPICLKVFPSGQALGGHKRAHYNFSVSPTKAEESMLMEQEASGLSIPSLNLPSQIKNAMAKPSLVDSIKSHECPICLKVFPSKQALGSHKRVHYVAVSPTKAEASILMEQEVSGLHIPSLNLPSEIKNVVASPSCHECPICLKVFPSYQALGGHIRAHNAEVAKAKAEESMLMEQEVSGFLATSSLDLSPTQMKSVMASRGCGGVGSDLKHMSVLISN